MDKIFSETEINKIKEIVSYLLLPISGRINMERCLVDIISTINNVVVEEIFYEIKFSSDKGNLRFIVNYPNIPDISPANYAWGIAAQIYIQLEKSLGEKRNELESRLWPIEDDYQPNFDKLNGL